MATKKNPEYIWIVKDHDFYSHTILWAGSDEKLARDIALMFPGNNTVMCLRINRHADFYARGLLPFQVEFKGGKLSECRTGYVHEDGYIRSYDKDFQNLVETDDAFNDIKKEFVVRCWARDAGEAVKIAEKVAGEARGKSRD